MCEIPSTLVLTTLGGDFDTDKSRDTDISREPTFVVYQPKLYTSSRAVGVVLCILQSFDTNTPLKGDMSPGPNYRA